MVPTPIVVMARRVRRSITSASAPPQSPNTISGTRAKAPASPTYAELDVIWKICCGTATTDNCAPMTVTTPDAHSRRKSRFLSGVVSARIELTAADERRHRPAA